MKNVLFLFILLAVLSANRMFSQNMFEGKLIYVQEMDKGLVSETQFMEYHKNGNVLTVMPDMKLKLLYRQDLGKLVSIQDMAGTPVITQKNLEKTDTVELEFADGLEQKGVFSCVRVTSMTQSNMMRGVNRSLVDTSYRIPYNYEHSAWFACGNGVGSGGERHEDKGSQTTDRGCGRRSGPIALRTAGGGRRGLGEVG